MIRVYVTTSWLYISLYLLSIFYGILADIRPRSHSHDLVIAVSLGIANSCLYNHISRKLSPHLKQSVPSYHRLPRLPCLLVLASRLFSSSLTMSVAAVIPKSHNDSTPTDIRAIDARNCQQKNGLFVAACP